MHHRIAIFGTALVALAGFSNVWAATDVGVSVQVNQPGVYGRIDIGNTSRPAVINTAPVVIMAPPPPQQQPQQRQVQAPEPVYMWVPPAHQRNWKRHCREYHACNQPVYFVQDQWYDANVRGGSPQAQGRGPEERRHGEHRSHDREERRDEGGDRGERGHGDHGGKHRD
jgi:hypothetical protein